MSFSGGGEQPTHIPNRQHSEPPRQIPPEYREEGEITLERVLKWILIVFAGITLLFAFALFATCETEPTPRQIQLTAEAESRDAGASER